MSETLVIRLLNLAPSPRAQWLLVDAQGARLGATLQGSLVEAAALATGRRVIVLVPGAEALHAEPVLPPLRGNTKLHQVVPYALEDQLASDVDALHFAVGRRSERPGTPVIVVSHDAMQRWIFALREVGLAPEALYTDTSVLPVMAGGSTLLIDQGRVSARHEDQPVTTLDIEPLSEALQLLLPPTDDAVTVYVAEPEYDAQQNVIEAVRDRAPGLHIKLLPDGVLPLLALRATQGEPINLLQGVYKPRTQLRGDLKSWRYAAAAALALLGVYVLTRTLEIRQLDKQEAALDQQIGLTYGQGLPGTAPVPAAEARRSFEARLQQAQAGSSANGLMSSLNVLAETRSQGGELEIEAVNFRNNQVELRVLAPSVDALEKVRQLAQTQGISAEIQSANPRDNRIEGRLQLQPPSQSQVQSQGART